MRNKMKYGMDNILNNMTGIKAFMLGCLMMVLAEGLTSLSGVNIFSQVLVVVGAFVILFNILQMFSWFLGLLLIGCIEDEHREERLSILSEHIDLAKSYLRKKK